MLGYTVVRRLPLSYLWHDFLTPFFLADVWMAVTSSPSNLCDQQTPILSPVVSLFSSFAVQDKLNPALGWWGLTRYDFYYWSISTLLSDPARSISGILFLLWFICKYCISKNLSQTEVKVQAVYDGATNERKRSKNAAFQENFLKMKPGGKICRSEVLKWPYVGKGSLNYFSTLNPKKTV